QRILKTSPELVTPADTLRNVDEPSAAGTRDALVDEADLCSGVDPTQLCVEKCALQCIPDSNAEARIPVAVDRATGIVRIAKRIESRLEFAFIDIEVADFAFQAPDKAAALPVVACLKPHQSAVGVCIPINHGKGSHSSVVGIVFE